jgi:hypothetical protein
VTSSTNLNQACKQGCGGRGRDDSERLIASVLSGG